MIIKKSLLITSKQVGYERRTYKLNPWLPVPLFRRYEAVDPLNQTDHPLFPSLPGESERDVV